MGNIFYFDWEVDLIEWLQGALGTVGELFAKVFSTIGGETVSLLILMVVLYCYRKEAGKRVGVSILTAGMWFPMIKNIVLRVRPYMAHEGRVKMLQIVEADAPADDIIQQGFSFPSGHCATAASMYGSLAREVKKRWMRTLAVVMILLIGLSRFVAGVHYPTDVLAGWAVGLVAVWFTALLEKKVKREEVRYAILLALTVPGIFWCTSRDYFSSLGLLIGFVAAALFEKKYVNFQDTRNPWAMILRVGCAFVLYAGLNTVLKLPFSKEFLANGTLGANLIRTARYAVIIFILLGIYPKCFPLFEKIGKKNRQGRTA